MFLKSRDVRLYSVSGNIFKFNDDNIIIFQKISLCARIKREEETTTSSTLDVIGQKLNVGLDATKQAFESTFTKENAEVSIDLKIISRNIEQCLCTYRKLEPF